MLCRLQLSAQYSNQYNEFQSAITRQRSSAAYLENIQAQARTPNIPYKGTGVDVSVFYSSRVKAPVVLTEAQKKSMADFEAVEKKKTDDLLAMQAKRDRSFAGMESILFNAGFAGNEVRDMKYEMTDDNGNLKDNYPLFVRYADFLEYYQRIKDSSSFDEIMLSISEFELHGPGTAYLAHRALQQRFPAKTLQLDIACAANLWQYFEQCWYSDNSNDYDAFTIRLAEDYLEMEKKYPEIRASKLSILQDFYNVSNPYSMLLKHILHQHYGKVSKEYKKMMKRFEAQAK
jgi:hypothetical protein